MSVKTTGRAKEFTIDRSKWLQGKYISWFEDQHENEISCDSMLRNETGMQCCLGFYSGACGVRGRTGISSPGDLPESERKKLDYRLFDPTGDSHLGSALMTRNDDASTSDEAREKYVKEKFASIGVKVKFTGKYPYAK